MTTVTSREVEITRYEWAVPIQPVCYAVHVDVHDAIDMAATAAEALGIDTSWDTRLRVTPSDDEIIFWSEIGGDRSTALTHHRAKSVTHQSESAEKLYGCTESRRTQPPHFGLGLEGSRRDRSVPTDFR